MSKDTLIPSVDEFRGNLPFIHESKSLTDALGTTSHNITCTGKIFSAISSKRRQAVKVISNTGTYLNSLQPVTKLDCKCGQFLSVPQNQSSGRGNTKTERRSRN